MKNTLFYLMAASVCLTACSKVGYEATTDGVIVTLHPQHPNEVHQVRLQVIDARTIRVVSTPEKSFTDRKSLIIVPQQASQPKMFTFLSNDTTVTLSTTEIQATVSLSTGEVSFTDQNGNLLLCEQKGGGKSFTPIEVEGSRGYTMHQVFESPDEEAFYGLGQHQSDEFNYKGKNEALFQYNTKVSVPFILSNKNYGLLFDNYSLSKFGDPRDYAQLSETFKLYDKDGKSGGLTATYIPAAKSGVQKLIRTEQSICYEDIQGIKNLPEGLPLEGANVHYEGLLEPTQTGTFRFHLYYAGYVKVYLNNELQVPERWRTAWNPNAYKFAISLEAGKRYPIRIEWQPDGAVSYLGLRALSPVDEKEQNKLSFYSEMGQELDYYFIYGTSMDEVISGYRHLTGKSQIMPKWAMGYWQSRERYKTSDELLSTLKDFRDRRFPIDNIVLDWSYWPKNAWGSHEFDRTRFPNPKGMVDSIHAQHAQMMISVWPKFYMTTEHYKELDREGWMYQQAIKDSIRDWIAPGYIGSFYDAYSEGARKLFWKQMNEHLYSLGIDAWWMDASEPNVRDCTDMAYRKKLCGPTALGSSTEFFNAYALMNAEAIYDGQRATNPEKRVFLLTRSGFAGLQRYSTATWSGDIATRWEDMKSQISAGLNFAMSGIPYWTMDIGGFCVEKRYEQGQKIYDTTGHENKDYKEWRELNTRWNQFGAFCPLYRSHGQFPFREPWHIAPKGHPAYRSMEFYTHLRYRMMPYIYSLAGMAYFNDYTLMRALVMDFGKDVNVHNIGDQYMFGPSLMVCPVYQYEARQREVYFPTTTGWYDLYTGTYLTGGQHRQVEAPYERIPLYVREGAILPYGPELQYTDEQPAREITLYVYGGQDGTFNLYEDEGVNYNYEQGSYATIPLLYNEASHSLIIGERKGNFPGMLKNRTFRVIFVTRDHPQPLNYTVRGIEVNYNGSEQIVKLQ